MNIGVIGAGYVGLVTAVCFADLGFKVHVVEKDAVKLKKLNEAQSTIYEPGLTELLDLNIKQGRLIFTDQIKPVVEQCEAVFLCVGTPSFIDGSADMSQIESATKEIVESTTFIKQKRLVVVKSTVPVGTAEWIDKISKLYSNGETSYIEIASNPEFLREGAAIRDFKEPERIVLGVASEWSKGILNRIYSSFDCPKIFTDSNTAEIIKYASNSFLATKISYINMVANLCEKVGADISKISEGMGYDIRIGRDFLNAGIGFGGSCFPKDLRAFLHTGMSKNVDFSLLEKVISINEDRPTQMVNKLKEMLWVLSGKKIAVLGLTFKPNTDDVRETPAVGLIEALVSEGATVAATDPLGIDNFVNMYPETAKNITFHHNVEEVFNESHAIVLVTDWKEYKELDWKSVKALLKLPVVLDARNCLDTDLMMENGFLYACVGREINK
ncbi:UDP-glucose 6-dehydrogenase TuaD [compost metagenome]